MKEKENCKCGGNCRCKTNVDVMNEHLTLEETKLIIKKIFKEFSHLENEELDKEFESYWESYLSEINKEY